MKNIGFLLLFSVLLIAIGLIGYFSTLDPDNFRSQTGKSLIGENDPLAPVLIGVIIGLCGLIAIVEPRATRYAMNGACGIALLGAIASSGPCVSSLLKLVYSGDRSLPNRYAIVLLPTAVICWLFVILSMRSSIAVKNANVSGSDKGKESA